MNAPVDVFIAYARQDERFCSELEKHLALLMRQRQLQAWSRKQIQGGQNWQDVLRANLDSAKLILLLVSADFFNSNTSYDMGNRAMERRRKHRVDVVPILLTPSQWEHSEIANLQPLPKNGQPISLWSNSDAAWEDVVNGIRDRLSAIARSVHSPGSETTDTPNVPESTRRDRPLYATVGLLVLILIALTVFFRDKVERTDAKLLPLPQPPSLPDVSLCSQTPRVIAKEVGATGIAVDSSKDGLIYITIEKTGDVKSIPKHRNGKTKLIASKQAKPFSINFLNGTVAWTSRGDGTATIYQGGLPSVLRPQGYYCTAQVCQNIAAGLAIDTGTGGAVDVFWVGGRKYHNDGKNEYFIVKNKTHFSDFDTVETSVCSIAVSGDRLFVVSRDTSSGGGIFEVRKNRRTPIKVGFAWIYGVAASKELVFITVRRKDSDSDSVGMLTVPLDASIDLDPSTYKEIAVGQQLPRCVVSDGTEVLWANMGTLGKSNGSIMASRILGDGLRVLAKNQAEPTALAIDRECAYWINATGEILVVSRLVD